MKRRIVRNRLVVLLIAIILACLIFALAHRHQPQQIETIPTQAPVVVANQPAPTPPPAKPLPPEIKITVKHGDSLYRIFKRNKIDYVTFKKILKLPDAKKYLSQLRAGRILFLNNDTKKHKIVIRYPIDDYQTLYVYSNNGKPSSRIATQPLTKHIVYRSATIRHNFIETARNAGLTKEQIHQLSNIFISRINFSRDLHPGDKFSILYNEYYWHDKKEKPGDIIAATLTNHRNTYTALRFTYPRNHTDYYTPDGQSIKPLFLSQPLHYKRITGYFTLHRYDPVLHIVHPHLGVDFAASYGTPVQSIGDGKIIFHGKKGGYGNAVIIHHSTKYKSLYGHLSRFAKGLGTGSTVKKGQVIGYVGNTGWATGPHLHFEMYIYGIPRNPLKTKFIGGEYIPKHYWQAFHRSARILVAELKMYRGKAFAVVDKKTNQNG